MNLFGINALLLFALPAFATAELPRTVNVLVQLVRWADHADRDVISREQINQLWNGPGYDYMVRGESMSEYLESNSYGEIQLEATVLDWYQSSLTEEEASMGSDKLEDVILPILKNTTSLSAFADSYGNIDGVVIVHSGYSSELGISDCVSNPSPTNTFEVNTPVTGEFTLKSFITVSAFASSCGWIVKPMNKLGGESDMREKEEGLECLRRGSY